MSLILNSHKLYHKDYKMYFDRCVQLRNDLPSSVLYSILKWVPHFGIIFPHYQITVTSLSKLFPILKKLSLSYFEMSYAPFWKKRVLKLSYFGIIFTNKNWNEVYIKHSKYFWQRGFRVRWPMTATAIAKWNTLNKAFLINKIVSLTYKKSLLTFKKGLPTKKKDLQTH